MLNQFGNADKLVQDIVSEVMQQAIKDIKASLSNAGYNLDDPIVWAILRDLLTVETQVLITQEKIKASKNLRKE